MWKCRKTYVNKLRHEKTEKNGSNTLSNDMGQQNISFHFDFMKCVAKKSKENDRAE